MSGPTEDSMSASDATVNIVAAELPAAPITLEGASILHQMFRFRWHDWRKLAQTHRAALVAEVAKALEAEEQRGRSALYALLGHKGDVMVLHFRDSFEELLEAEL